MKNIIRQIKANRRVAIPAAIVMLAAILLRFPEAIGFLSEDIRSSMLKTASEIVSWAWTAILLLLKSSGTSGIGTPQDPLVKTSDTGQSKKVVLPMLLACGLLSGCAADGSFDSKAHPERRVYPPGAPFPVYP